jgi:putative SOS response-associated peptidase YedK
LQSFTIMTTDPNELTAEVHTRMPVILPERDWDRWLRRAESDPARLPIDLLRPYPTEDLEAYKAHHDVGNIRNNSIDLLNSRKRHRIAAALHPFEFLVENAIVR